MSSFSFEGTGVVIEDLPPTGKIAKIYLLDIQEHTGTIGNETPVSVIVSDSVTKAKPLVGTEVDYIEALWEGSDNKITAPTLRKGEQVSVYKYMNQDKFYWSKSRGFETDVRGREVIVNGVSTIDREVDGNIGKSATKENMYYTRMDSINGVVELKTNKDNGEKAAYHVLFNTMTGNFNLKDDLGNSIILDSVKGTLSVVSKNKITLDAPTVEIKCKDFNIDTTNTKFNSKNTVFTGNKFTNKVPTNILDGNLKVTKATVLEGTGIFTGGIFKSAVTFLSSGKTW